MGQTKQPSMSKILLELAETPPEVRAAYQNDPKSVAMLARADGHKRLMQAAGLLPGSPSKSDDM